MKPLITWLVLLLSGLTAYATPSEPVTKEDAIAAFREYRRGVKLITAIHSDLMQASWTATADKKLEITAQQKVDYQQARKHLQKSISLNPYFPDAYVVLANSYWELENDLQQTLTYYNKALEIDPDYDDVISARGQVLILLKRVADAEKDLQRLEALESDHAPALREQITELKAQRKQSSE